MTNSGPIKPGMPGMPCPNCGERIAVPMTRLLTATPVICASCGGKLEPEWSASDRVFTGLAQFGRRLRDIGAAVRIRVVLSAVDRVTAAFYSYWAPDLIQLNIASLPVFPPVLDPVEARRVVTVNLAGLDCTLVLARGESEGLRRIRELLEARS